MTFKPSFKARAIPGGIRLDWKKRGVDGVIVFCRLRGQTKWNQIGVDTSSPFLDARPLETTGVPEVREYMLRGMVNDQPIGLNSDVQSVTWGGR